MDDKPGDLDGCAGIGNPFEPSEQTQNYYEFQRSHTYFSNYDEDDEVFESETTTLTIAKVPRTRRISDVIDSVGDMSPGPDKRHSFTDFPDNSPSFLKKGQGFYLDVKEGQRSPPPTPCSDLGYDSTSGLNSPPSQMILRPKWFRYSNPSVESTSPSRWDTTDATPIFDIIQGSVGGVEQGRMPVSRESDEYNMNHARRGCAIIFNHDEFNSTDMPSRKGSHIDVQQLETVYQMLGFEVRTYHNLDCNEVKSVIKEVSELDHSDCDCLLITVLTHGLKSNYLFAKDFAYPTETLWLPFTGDKCVTLAGKPKIFIIQACRGEALDGGVRLVRNTHTDSGSSAYKIPTMADFLIAYSTAEGYFSWRHPENGTWFIQSLCKVLSNYYDSLDFLKMMIRVSQKVAVDYESYNDLYMDRHGQKQVPNLHSTLIRDIYFRPKV